ncbi:MAG TPA: hypothetical protein VFE62_10375, partial [Gemmataceae bacterium]|nr:hypothetical protein [Gemmataceae bacterium]
MAKPPGDSLVVNRILAALPHKEFRRILTHLEPVSLNARDIIHEPYKPIDYVYFPESGVVSKVASTEDGACVEVGMTGREGMTGLCLFLGVRRTSPFKAIVQVPGKAKRLKAILFDAEVERNAAWTGILLDYTHAVLSVSSQLAQPIA